MNSSTDEPQPKRQKTISDPSANNQLESNDNHSSTVNNADSKDDDVTSDYEEDDCSDCELDKTEWLKIRYGGTDMVTVTFQSKQDKYYFPKEILVNAFGYFKGALRANEGEAFFMEGQTKTINLKTVSAADFGLCLKWVQQQQHRPCNPGHQNLELEDCMIIEHVLRVIVAATYPDMRLTYLEGFTEQLSRRLQEILLVDRCILTLEHIHHVQTHPAFSQHVIKTKIMEVFANAAVRPTFEQYILEIGEEPRENGVDSAKHLLVMTKDDCAADPYPSSLPEYLGDWSFTIKHFIGLTTDNHEYGTAVLRQMARSLVVSRRLKNNKARLEYYKDPLAYNVHQCSESPRECMHHFLL